MRILFSIVLICFIIVGYSQHYKHSLNTGNNSTLIFSKNLGIRGEIGVFSENLLVGSGVYNGEATAVTIWGDDVTTGGIIEGLVEGEKYDLRLWNGKEEVKLEVEYLEGDNIYETDGISIIKRIKTKPVLVFPNPTTGKINFLTDGTISQIVFYDIEGRVIYSGVRNIYDFPELKQGRYFYKLIFTEGNMTIGSFNKF